MEAERKAAILAKVIPEVEKDFSQERFETGNCNWYSYIKDGWYIDVNYRCEEDYKYDQFDEICGMRGLKGNVYSLDVIYTDPETEEEIYYSKEEVEQMLNTLDGVLAQIEIEYEY